MLNTVFCGLVKLHKDINSTTFYKKTVKNITNVNHVYNIMLINFVMRNNYVNQIAYFICIFLVPELSDPGTMWA